MEDEHDTDMLDVGPISFIPTFTSVVPTRANSKVLDFIDNTFNSIITALETHYPPTEICVTIKRNDGSRCIWHSAQLLGIGCEENEDGFWSRPGSREVRYCWPGSTPEAAWRFGKVN